MWCFFIFVLVEMGGVIALPKIRQALKMIREFDDYMELDVSKLKEGQEIKNYKVMCQLLGQVSSTGKSRQLQEKDWRRYISYHKQGNKYIIDEIYDKVLPKIDNRSKGNNSVYIDNIELLILDILAQKENNGILFVSCPKLLEQLGFVNGNYSAGRNNRLKLSELLMIDKDLIDFFYNDTFTRLKRNLENALNRMQKNGYIFWQRVFMIKDNNTQLTRVANDSEIEIIINAQCQVLKDMGKNNINEIVLFGLWDTFHHQVCSILQNEFNISNYYNVYKIINNKEFAIRTLKRLESEIKEGYRKIINDEFIERYTQTNKKRHEEALTNDIKLLDCIYGFDLAGKKVFNTKVIDDNYTMDMKKATDATININTKIIDELMN